MGSCALARALVYCKFHRLSFPLVTLGISSVIEEETSRSFPQIIITPEVLILMFISPTA